MIGVQLVLLDFFRVDGPDGALRHLFADAWVYLAHLRALADLQTLVSEVVGRLHCSKARGCPDREGTQGNVSPALFDEGGALLFAVAEKSLGHLGSVHLALL